MLVGNARVSTREQNRALLDFLASTGDADLGRPAPSPIFAWGRGPQTGYDPSAE